MSTASKSIINSKVLFLLTQFIACIYSLLIRGENIASGMNPNFKITDSNYQNADQLVLGVGVVSVLFQFAQMGLISLSLTLQFDQTNIIIMMMHFVGTITYVLYLLEKWHYYTLLYLFLVFCFVPLLIEFSITVMALTYYSFIINFVLARLQRKASQPKEQAEDNQLLLDNKNLQEEKEKNII